MKVQTLKLAYFSPTGTTRKVLQSIAKKISCDKTELIDITKAATRAEQIQTAANDLLIVGVPVYMGRVPEFVSEWLHTIKADNTPAVCIVVYGNREYDNALLELKDILTEAGCKPLAFGAYIGEHSFSSAELPTAANRPDASDLSQAELFGNKINEKIQSINSIDQIYSVTIPGVYPYAGVTKLWDVDFISVNDSCTQCGLCSEICPMNAIAATDSRTIDITKCITCCACIKNCSQQARSIKAGPVKDAATRLNTLYSERKEPVFFV